MRRNGTWGFLVVLNVGVGIWNISFGTPLNMVVGIFSLGVAGWLIGGSVKNYGS